MAKTQQTTADPLEDVPGESRWDRRRRRRTEEIIEVAMRLIMEEGLEACSLHRISRELDVAVAGLYRYFPSKMALIAALEVRVVREITAAFVATRQGWSPAETKVEFLARCVAESEVYRHYALEGPSRFALISQIMADPNVIVPGEMGKQVLVTMMELLAGVARTLAEAADSGALWPGDSIQRSILFWNGLRSVIQMKKLEAHSSLVSHERLYRAMLRTLLIGWGADPSVLAEAETLASSGL